VKNLESKYGNLDPEIVDLVRALHQIGISTIWSSGGSVESGKVPYPYVDIEPEDCDPGALEELGRTLVRIKDKFFGHPLNWLLDDSVQVSRGEYFTTVRRLHPENCNPEGSQGVLETLQGGAQILTGSFKIAREVTKMSS